MMSDALAEIDGPPFTPPPRRSRYHLEDHDEEDAEGEAHPLIGGTEGGSNSLMVLLTCAFAIVYFAGYSFLNYWQIHLYAKYNMDFCEADMPLWLLVSGCSGFLGLLILSGAFTCLEETLYLCFLGLYGAFALSWMVVGSVWLYSIPKVVHDCPEPVFDFCWYFLTMTWIVVGVVIAVSTMMPMVRWALHKQYDSDDNEYMPYTQTIIKPTD